MKFWPFHRSVKHKCAWVAISISVHQAGGYAGAGDNPDDSKKRDMIVRHGSTCVVYRCSCGEIKDGIIVGQHNDLLLRLMQSDVQSVGRSGI